MVKTLTVHHSSSIWMMKRKRDKEVIGSGLQTHPMIVSDAHPMIISDASSSTRRNSFYSGTQTRSVAQILGSIIASIARFMFMTLSSKHRLTTARIALWYLVQPKALVRFCFARIANSCFSAQSLRCRTARTLRSCSSVQIHPSSNHLQT